MFTDQTKKALTIIFAVLVLLGTIIGGGTVLFSGIFVPEFRRIVRDFGPFLMFIITTVGVVGAFYRWRKERSPSLSVQPVAFGDYTMALEVINSGKEPAKNVKLKVDAKREITEEIEPKLWSSMVIPPSESLYVNVFDLSDMSDSSDEEIRISWSYEDRNGDFDEDYWVFTLNDISNFPVQSNAVHLYPHRKLINEFSSSIGKSIGDELKGVIRKKKIDFVNITELCDSWNQRMSVDKDSPLDE